MSDWTEFRRRLAERMLMAKGLSGDSERGISARAGLSASAFTAARDRLTSEDERAKDADVGVVTLARFAAACGVSLAWLASGEGEPRPREGAPRATPSALPPAPPAPPAPQVGLPMVDALATIYPERWSPATLQAARELPYFRRPVVTAREAETTLDRLEASIRGLLEPRSPAETNETIAERPPTHGKVRKPRR